MLSKTGLIAFAAVGLKMVQAAALPNPGSAATGVSLGATSHWGTACPQDSAVSVGTSGNNIIAHCPSFSVHLGGAQADAADFCGIGVAVNVPGGQQFSVASSSYHDIVNVGSGETGIHLMTYTFSGVDGTAETRHTFTGPVNGAWDITDSVPGASRVWSDCGESATLLITNRGYVTGSGSSPNSVFNDGGIATTCLEWRSC